MDVGVSAGVGLAVSGGSNKNGEWDCYRLSCSTGQATGYARPELRVESMQAEAVRIDSGCRQLRVGMRCVCGCVCLGVCVWMCVFRSMSVNEEGIYMCVCVFRSMSVRV